MLNELPIFSFGISYILSFLIGLGSLVLLCLQSAPLQVRLKPLKVKINFIPNNMFNTTLNSSPNKLVLKILYLGCIQLERLARPGKGVHHPQQLYEQLRQIFVKYGHKEIDR